MRSCFLKTMKGSLKDPWEEKEEKKNFFSLPFLPDFGYYKVIYATITSCHDTINNKFELYRLGFDPVSCCVEGGNCTVELSW
jgi:hypothetical protein